MDRKVNCICKDIYLRLEIKDMYNWRITKYNPKFRDESGSFLSQEWTSYHDIGKVFGTHILTYSDYKKMEDDYVAIVSSFMDYLDIDKLVVN